MAGGRQTILTAVCAGLLVAGCTTGEPWKTSYQQVITAEQSARWRVSQIDVTVPRTLSVSEANSYAPTADIVWREDPLGDRYDQVDRIITEAARQGASKLRGGKPVVLKIEVHQFHALTEKTRRRLQNAGVHNIEFTAQVFDAATGEALTPPDRIDADLIAYSGEQARAAEARGETQKVRIIAHVSRVVAGWLAAGPDVRGSFSRSGR